MRQQNWFTLAEISQAIDIQETEAQRAVEKCGSLLSPRNFGDITKYPAPVIELLSRFNKLQQQGCTIEDLHHLLVNSREETQELQRFQYQDRLEGLHQQSIDLLESIRCIGNQMQTSSDMVASLLETVHSLNAKVAKQQREISELRNHLIKLQSCVDQI